MESPDFTSGLIQAFSDFRSAWFLGVTALCYLGIQILRGKIGFQIPYVTSVLENQSKEIKTYLVILLFSLAGLFSAFGAPNITFVVLLDGFLKGLALGIGTIGTRSVIKQGIEGTQAYLENKKQAVVASKDQDGSEK